MAFKVSIYKEPWNAGISIMLWEERDGRIFVANPIKLTFSEEKQTTNPTIRCDHFSGPALLKAFAESLDENGIKTDRDAKLLGTISAKDKHLEDLRHLLKLPKSKQGESR